MKASPLSLLSLVLIPAVAHAQTPAPPPAKFIAADIHTAPPTKFPYPDGGKVYGDRYIMRQATMVDLIAKAYDVDPSRVEGGPSWLEMDRFDVTAKTAPETTVPATRQMLQGLLAERFHLALHPASRPLPAYVITAPKGASKLRPAADASAEAGCQPEPMPTGGGPLYITVHCKNFTMARLADEVHQMANGYLDRPVVDQTNLSGTFDVDIKWSPRNLLAQQGSDGISIFDAFDKELGLKLALETAPRPVLAVDHVDRTPTPNASDIATILPPPPPPQFDVATIKPSAPGEKPFGNVRPTVLDFKNIPMKIIFAFAFDLNPNDSEAVVGLPHEISEANYDIYAKMLVEPGDRSTSPSALDDGENLLQAVQGFLVERFGVKYHYENRPVSSYNLVAVKPTMQAADPNSRTHCIEGPNTKGSDPRFTNTKLNRLVTCQNMTMAQLGVELQRQAAGYIYNPVEDDTGLKGGYDFTLSFSSADLMGSGDKPKPGDADNGAASDPNGALSLPEAVRRQLGLKLEKVKRPARVLVIDHIEPKPTEN